MFHVKQKNSYSPNEKFVSRETGLRSNARVIRMRGSFERSWHSNECAQREYRMEGFKGAENCGKEMSMKVLADAKERREIPRLRRPTHSQERMRRKSVGLLRSE
jgi:hypothetical protein